MEENQAETRPAGHDHTQEEQDLGLNFSCMLFLFTELMALFNELTKVLNEKEVLTQEDVQKVFEVTGNKEELHKIYGAVTQRFVQYYGTARQSIANAQAATAAAENSAGGETPQESPEGDSQ